MSTRRRVSVPEAERAFLERYRGQAAAYARPSVAVDIVVFTIVEDALRVLLVRRGEPPFQGSWALPGGFLRVGDVFDDQGEDLDAAAARELSEETGLAPGTVFLEQLHTFGRAHRDPRLRVISVAYYALVPPQRVLSVRAGTDAAATSWHGVSERERTALQLAFDHHEILAHGLGRLRQVIEHSAIAFELVTERFTITDLRRVYEIIAGEPLDPGNFRRKFQRLLDDGWVVPSGGTRKTSARPAQLYRFMRR